MPVVSARHLLRLSFLLPFALVAATSCGPSVQQVCDDYANAWCEARFRCYTGATLTDFQAMYGMTAAACATTKESPLYANCTSATPICATGTSYDTGAGETCVSKLGLQACQDIISGVDPMECSESSVCH